MFTPSLATERDAGKACQVPMILFVFSTALPMIDHPGNALVEIMPGQADQRRSYLSMNADLLKN